MRIYVLDGTPEEIHEALPQLAGRRQRNLAFLSEISDVASGATFADDSEIEADAEHAVSVETAAAILTRAPLQDNQRDMLITIYGQHPLPVSASTLQEMFDQTTAQFRGFMGAWGKRCTHTDGYEDGQVFFLKEWDAEQQCYLYRLPDSVRQALEDEAIVYI